jgi:tight adherence protein B
VSLLAGWLAGVGILLWPGRFDLRALVVLPGMSSAYFVVPTSAAGSARERVRQFLSSYGLSGHGLSGRSAAGLTAPDLLSLLEAIAPALEAGMAPASALWFAADARSGSGRHDPLAALAAGMASAAADGATLGPLWRKAAESAGSAELLLLAQAWSLTEDMGAPLAQAVRTAAGLLEARIAHERRLTGALAGAKATVSLLTVLPVGGPLLGLVLGISPGELYGGSRLTQGSLVLGLCLAGIGRWWVHRMVRAVARGPVIA